METYSPAMPSIAQTKGSIDSNQLLNFISVPRELLEGIKIDLLNRVSYYHIYVLQIMLVYL
jgi:cytochrome c2